MARSLTPKQEGYCQARAQGKNPSAAYRLSRDTSKMSTATVNANAKKMERKLHIKARIEELRRDSRESPLPTASRDASAGGLSLSPKREAFARFFVETSNACEAYRRAFNVRPKTKPQTVAKRASELLADGKVAGRISQLRAELAKRHDVDLDRWLAEQTAIGFADITEAVEWGETVVVRNEKGEIVDERQSVRVKASRDMPRQIRTAIQSIKQRKDGGLEVKFHSKQGALDAIAKHMGWFEKDNRQASEAAADALAAAADRSGDDLARRLALMLSRGAEARRKRQAGGGEIHAAPNSSNQTTRD
jgi:hypothetical protein